MLSANNSFHFYDISKNHNLCRQRGNFPLCSACRLSNWSVKDNKATPNMNFYFVMIASFIIVAKEIYTADSSM